jgi:hypothetical protein
MIIIGTGDLVRLRGFAAISANAALLVLLDDPLPYPGGDCGGDAGTPWMIGPTANGLYHWVLVCGTSWLLMIAELVLRLEV